MMETRLEKDYDKYGEMELSLLSEIGSMGIGKAATSLSGLIGKEVMITIPEVVVVNPTQIPDLLNLHEECMVTVYEEFHSNSLCDILLVFRKGDAEKIVESIKQNYGVEKVNPSEFIEEVGNIMITGFLNSISDFTGITILPKAPIYVEDLFDAIIDVFLANIVAREEDAVLLRTNFKCGVDVQPYFITFFNEEFRQRLIKCGQSWTG
jgi:chemotaxis protein CheC